jgi:ribosomal 50S subunit-associated protein YjgA (DUF615 family)
MSLIGSLHARSKVRQAINEAHEERAKNGPPPSLTELFVLTCLGQLMTKADKKAALQPLNSDIAS